MIRSAPTGLVLVLALAMLAPSTGSAQFGGTGSYALEEGERNLKLAAVPVPNYSDVLGVSLGVVGMAYYKLDRDDPDLPPSLSGLMGFYSENNSWAGGIFQRFFFPGGAWRATGAAGTASIKFQFNPSTVLPGFPDVFVDYTTASDFLFLKGERRVAPDLYLGLEALAWSAQVNLEPGLTQGATERFRGLGPTVNWDTRDQMMFPTHGHALDVRWDVYGGALASDRDFSKLTLEATAFASLGDSTRVLAGRFRTEAGFGNVPFSSQAIVSGRQNLRGYASGRYRGDVLMTWEGEYRWMFHGRWGATAFAGFGFVGNDLADYRLADVLPSGGLGLRYRMVEAYRVNARIDYGWGRNDQALVISIGESY